MGSAEARGAYERVVRDYPEQAGPVAEARSRLAALGAPAEGRSDSSIVARQLWAGAGVDLSGRPSTDGRFITFVDWSRSTGNVAIRSLATGETRLLTNGRSFAEGHASIPVISLDGAQIAYKWYGPTATSPSSLRVVRTDGTGARVLVQNAGQYLVDLAWAPDGKRIAAVFTGDGADLTSHIALVSVSDGAVTRLKTTGWRAPRLGGFSPDGRYLLYWVLKNTPAEQSGIFAIAVDGSRETALVQSPAQDRLPVWTNDSAAIVFLSDRSGRQDLWSLALRDGTPQGEAHLVRPNIGDIVNPGFARDGSFFYGFNNSRTDVFVARINADELEVVSRPQRLSDRLIGSNSAGSWSPDGRFIAFLREGKTVVIRSVADGTERALPTPVSGGTREGPQWTPDGRALFLHGIDRAKQQMTVRRVDVTTGSEATTFEGRYGEVADLRISRDGHSLFYTTWEAAAGPGPRLTRLMRRNLDDGAEEELYRSSLVEPLFGLSLSPDGRTLAFLLSRDAARRTLVTMPVQGGTPREVSGGGNQQYAVWRSVWTPDGRHLLFVGSDISGRNRVFAVPARGGEPKPLDLTMKQIVSPDLSPDGEQLVFTGIESAPELWVIKNLLPRPEGGK
jgi:Tol biopolymer transport system component